MSKKRVGFAKLKPTEHRALAVKGGKSVPAEKRSFAQDPDLAVRAGSVGGKASAEAKRRRKEESMKVQ